MARATGMRAPSPCCLLPPPWSRQLRLLALRTYTLLAAGGWGTRGGYGGRPASSRPHASADSGAPAPPPAADPTGPWLLVGLGNPGAQYERTRHNAGFELLDRLAASEGISLDSVQHKALVGRGRLGGEPVIFAKPQTFMNRSGDAVGALARYYKIPASRLVVMYDDMDLEVAQVRLRGKGGHGGHNGMRSVLPLAPGPEFARVRLGIGRPAGRKPVEAHVLEAFDASERVAMEAAYAEAALAVRCILTLGLEPALSAAGRWAEAMRPKAPRPVTAGDGGRGGAA